MSPADATKLYLITGFLGSGKTTLLQQRLDRVDKTVGVLVNDFGKINFDSLSIQGQAAQMVELSNGSIFCSCLKETFIEKLADLLGRGLDEVYIESSGLADPSEMDKILETVRQNMVSGSFVYGGSICLIDGLYFFKALAKMASVERQIRHSHLLVINKTDLISDEEVSAITQKLATLNPTARIICARFGQIDWQDIPTEIKDVGYEPTTNRQSSRNKSLVLHLEQPPRRQAFESFLADLRDYFYRVKGSVCLDDVWYKVDLVNQWTALLPQHPDHPAKGSGDLVLLPSQGLESISHLAQAADRHLAGLFNLEM